nr:MAG TPA: hypothetical protein [Caudoviricetes sp.]
MIFVLTRGTQIKGRAVRSVIHLGRPMATLRRGSKGKRLQPLVSIH